MKTLVLLLVSALVSFRPYDSAAQELGHLRRASKISLPAKLHNPFPDPLPAGTYTIGTFGDFPSIDSAFTRLGSDGVAGAVTLELIDSLYVAPPDEMFVLQGPIPGAGPGSMVTIQHGQGQDVTVEGSANAVFYFMNTSYLALIYGEGRGRLIIHAVSNDAYPWNDGIDFVNNSDHNVVSGIDFITDDITRGGAGLAFLSESGVDVAPDSNLIEGNYFGKGALTIYISGYGSSVRPTGNNVRGNVIGSETDSLISWGIQVEYDQGTTVENNIVQKIRQQSPTSIITPGINALHSFDCIIRNNVVHDVESSERRGSAGILLSGDVGLQGFNNEVYNNMVYDIQSTSPAADSRVAGIQIWHQVNPKIDYNSVYLSGTGANASGSAAFYVHLSCSNIEAKNNILINVREESPFVASVMYDYTTTNLTSDYNDLFCHPGENNCIARIGATRYTTLADWQAMAQDVNSISAMADFVAPDLHINVGNPTGLDSSATPISGINLDLDGDPRDLTNPDIGADEFSTVVGIKESATLPDHYLLHQNYPNPFNPATVIDYALPRSAYVRLEVFNVLGERVSVLSDGIQEAGYRSVVLEAEGLPSGIYFYRLRAGDFVKTRKMILMK